MKMTQKMHYLNAIGQFIGRPQTFVELQLRFNLHFYTRKMQFETWLELHKRLWTINELTECVLCAFFATKRTTQN